MEARGRGTLLVIWHAGTYATAGRQYPKYYMNGKQVALGKECTRAKKARFGEATDAASRRLERKEEQGQTCAPPAG